MGPIESWDLIGGRQEGENQQRRSEDWSKRLSWGKEGPQPQKERFLNGNWKRLGNELSPSVCRRNQSCQHLDSRLLASRSTREQVCVVLSHYLCGSLLQQQKEMNTPSPMEAQRCVGLCSNNDYSNKIVILIVSWWVIIFSGFFVFFLISKTEIVNCPHDIFIKIKGTEEPNFYIWNMVDNKKLTKCSSKLSLTVSMS